MAVKSVIDIDVNDGQFKRFSQLFSKYQDALSKTPAAWQKVGKETKNAGSSFQDMTAALMAQNQLHREIGATADKSGKTLQHHASLWNTIHKSTTGVLGNVTDIAKWLTKMGIGLGLGALGTGIAGLFGLLAMGKDISNERNFALSTGIPIGYQNAFEKNQGAFFQNPDQILQQSYKASQIGTQQQGIAKSLGIDTSGNAYQIADRMLLAVQAKAKGMPSSYVDSFVRAYHLDEFGLDTGGVQLLRSLSRNELQKRIDTGTSIGRQNVLSDKQGKKAQDFVQGIENTFSKVSKSTERAILNSKLLDSVKNFIEAIGKDVSLFVSSGAAAKGLDTLSDAIQKFAKYVGSKEFQKDLKNFTDNAGGLVKFISHPVDTTGQFYFETEKGGDITDVIAANAEARKRAYQIEQQIILRRTAWGMAPAMERTNIPITHIHIDPLPLIKIHVTKIPGGDAVKVIQQLHGGVAQ